MGSLSNKRTARGNAVAWIPIVLAFPVVGLLVGWLVGASNSPAVGALLPLVFGIFGAVSFGALEKRTRRDWLKSSLASVEPKHTDELRLRIENLPETSLKTPAIWSSGVILFCAACFFGVRVGIAARIPCYKPLSELVALKDLTVKEQSLLHRIRWHLLAQRIRTEEAEAFFGTTIAAALKERDPNIRYEKLSQVAGSLELQTGHERGLASEDPPIPAEYGRWPG